MTRKTDYGLVAMAHLAAPGGGSVSARELARRLQLRVPVLMNVLNRLAHAGLVRSTRGASGGYELARSPEGISLADLIEAIDGPVKLARCCCEDDVDDVDRCDLEGSCAVREPVRKVHEGLRGYLQQVTLAHIASHDVPIHLGFVRGAAAVDVLRVAVDSQVN
ncbi:MAG: Rrf2 family transcriptional regulator [Phycisphaerales bacterium]|nr:Rrf2 family transcriptional regulator [Phycisphaerales bacterium]